MSDAWYRRRKLDRREELIVSHEFVLNQPGPLAEWIEQTRSDESIEGQIALQREFAEAAFYLRKVARDLAAERKAVAAEIGGFPSGPSVERDELVGRRNELDVAMLANRRRFIALRTVIDAVVWRMVEFDRAWLSVIGLGEQVGWPSDSFESELGVAELWWDRGCLAVLCDLTNVARTGDLVVLDPSENKVWFQEVKESAAAARRQTRQTRRGEERVSFLTTGESRTLVDDAGTPLVRTPNPARLETHLDDLATLLTTARSNGAADAQVSEHLYVVALDMRADSREQAADGTRAELMGRKWSGQDTPPDWDDTLIWWFDSAMHLNAAETRATEDSAPFALYPVESETAAALCLGTVAFGTALYLPPVLDSLRDVALNPRQSGEKYGFIDVDVELVKTRRVKASRTYTVNLAVRQQFLLELLTLGAFANYVRVETQHIATSAPTPGHYRTAPGWSDQRAVWR